MIIIRTLGHLSELIDEILKDKKQIGFVPTMGALHAGHAALIERCVREKDVCICSVFINPAQFNNPEDLKNYPRTEAADIELLDRMACHAVFMPSTEEMYPDNKLLEMDFGQLENVMEGKYRPGHFRGVATIVNKLFRAVKPHDAYFGEKDFQQLMVIRQMVNRLQIPVRIVACPTVRESDGLALSSRNVRLTDAERKSAAVIYRSLCEAAAGYKNQSAFEDIRKSFIRKTEQSGLFRVEYFEMARADAESGTLEMLTSFSGTDNVRMFTAVQASQVRLIDNLAVE